MPSKKLILVVAGCLLAVSIFVIIYAHIYVQKIPETCEAFMPECGYPDSKLEKFRNVPKNFALSTYRVGTKSGMKDTIYIKIKNTGAESIEDVSNKVRGGIEFNVTEDVVNFKMPASDIPPGEEMIVPVIVEVGKDAVVGEDYFAVSTLYDRDGIELGREILTINVDG